MTRIRSALGTAVHYARLVVVTIAYAATGDKQGRQH